MDRTQRDGDDDEEEDGEGVEAILSPTYRSDLNHANPPYLSRPHSDRDGVGRGSYSNTNAILDALDAEYGGPLVGDDENPFSASGALDPAMAIIKKA